MFRKFADFWKIFFDSIRRAYNKAFKAPLDHVTQEWRDVLRMNLLATCVNKLANLALNEATIDVQTDSAVAEPLITLGKDIEDKRYQITEEMLGEGDYCIFPAFDENGNLYHTYLTQQQFRITQMVGDEITEAYGIIDWYTDDKNNQTYYLLRHHVLDENGNLTISYTVRDADENRASVPQWEYLANETVQYQNANHIGFGRFKSPVSSRGLSPVYGVPLNFGCSETEEQIFADIEAANKEVKNAESKIFTDPRNLKQDEMTGKWRFADNIFAINQRAGQGGSNIDVYAPPIRFAEFNAKTISDMRAYEQQIGVDRGFLTEFDSGRAVTATEVRRANASTIAMIDKIHNAVAQGIEETLKADAVFLNVAPDLYAVKIDWYDPFDDAEAQWQRLLDAHAAGVVESEDLIRWLYPDMSAEEIAEKLERIGAQAAAQTNAALENILSGV